MKNDFFKITASLFLFYSVATSQTIRISGTVRDANTRREISGVSVFIIGSQWGTITAASGQYHLEIPSSHLRDRIKF